MQPERGCCCGTAAGKYSLSALTPRAQIRKPDPQRLIQCYECARLCDSCMNLRITGACSPSTHTVPIFSTPVDLPEKSDGLIQTYHICHTKEEALQRESSVRLANTLSGGTEERRVGFDAKQSVARVVDYDVRSEQWGWALKTYESAGSTRSEAMNRATRIRERIGKGKMGGDAERSVVALVKFNAKTRYSPCIGTPFARCW